MTDAARAFSDEDRILVGEYVLGTLPSAERAALAARLAVEPALAAEADRWGALLDPLGAEVTPILPPERLRAAIERRLFGEAARAHRAVARATGWVWALGGSLVTAAAAGLIALAVVPRPDTPDAPVAGAPAAPAPPATPASPPTLYVSDMVSADGTVRLTALFDDTHDEMRVSVAGPAPAPGRDFELWLIDPAGPVISLGVMPHQGNAAMPIPADLAARLAVATLAITDEPAGGAPGGVATGPVVAQATMRRI